jgi:putative SOS response-associated peptidase YedK
VTTSANDLVRPVHDRMPVVIPMSPPNKSDTGRAEK